jgi:hypothetical protein
VPTILVDPYPRTLGQISGRPGRRLQPADAATVGKLRSRPIG